MRKYCNCFNENGCDKHNIYGGVDNQLVLKVKNCPHEYCDKFKWIIDRAKHYAEKTGLIWEAILDQWEESRNYWYMNYYQECNQPEIKDENVMIFETVEDLHKSVGDIGFRCPLCNGISTNPYECNTGIKIGKNDTGKTCNWVVYGLLRDLGKGVYVFVKEEVKGERMFMPVTWENKDMMKN